MTSTDKYLYFKREKPESSFCAQFFSFKFQKDSDFASVVKNVTEGHGADLILDCVGGSYWELNAEALATDGTWIVYGLLGG